MTLRQKIYQLITQWQGLDAAEQSARRQQLISDLMSLIEQNQQGKATVPQRRPRAERERAA